VPLSRISVRKQIVSETPERAAGTSQPAPNEPGESGETPSGPESNIPGLLNLVHSQCRVYVSFNYKDLPDEARVAKYRTQLLEFVQRTNCKSLTFDLAGIKILPSRMLGLFVNLRNEGHDIELVNLEQAVQDIFRITKLGPMFTIRDHTE
jgi:anti-anti-sigma factor